MYAAEIAVGDKPEEYRTWKTDYRGDLLICASTYNDGWEYPRGFALCVVNLYDIKWLEEDECYAWLLKDIRPVIPFPVKGRLHLYDVDDKLIRFVRKKPNVQLFNWWQFDLEIIKAPENKGTKKPKPEAPKNAKVKGQKPEIAKPRRPRLRSIY